MALFNALATQMKKDFAVAFYNYTKECKEEYYETCADILSANISLINISIKHQLKVTYGQTAIICAADIDADGVKIGWYKEVFNVNGQYIDDFLVIERSD